MLDGQFSSQNGTGAPPGVAGGPGISLIVAPPGAASTPEQNKWIAAEMVRQDAKKIQMNDNMSTMDRFILCASELCGTAILVFLGCTGCIDFTQGLGPPIHLAVCFTFGLAVMVSVQCFGHVSGSHINPLITVAAATMGVIPLVQVPIYIVGQVLGALAGMGLLKMATPASLLDEVRNATSLGICSPHVNPIISPLQGLLVEFLISFILALVCCGVWDSRNSTKIDSVPIRFGLTITALALAAGPYTGANMNPARSFAPALINGDWEYQWLYWVGPIAGAFAAALLYRFVFAKDQVEDDHETTAEVIPLNDKA